MEFMHDASTAYRPCQGVTDIISGSLLPSSTSVANSYAIHILSQQNWTCALCGVVWRWRVAQAILNRTNTTRHQWHFLPTREGCRQRARAYLGGPVDDGRDEAAGPAPVSDEVDEHGQVRLHHLRLELALLDELPRRAAEEGRRCPRERDGEREPAGGGEGEG
uniref:Uncharacterized protein n=1 Tax=Triticum urartu TaxID=4572 RepID=A0A8R7TCU1_TRIUA